MGMHGQGMMEGGHMMGGMPGMILFGLLYVLGIVLFLWLMFRGVKALETIADNTKDDS